MIRNVGAQMGQGSRLQTAVARAAQIYNSKSGTETPMGVCRCKGGPAHCPGCEAIPIYRTFSKPRGIDGRPGQVGDSAQESLGRGVTGPEGRGVITVIHRNGERIRYNKRYKLQLVNFDLEDENGDGIFEPGEHIFVRRIVLKNVGKWSSCTAQDLMLTIFQGECPLQAVRFRAESSRPIFSFHSRMTRAEQISPFQYLLATPSPPKTLPGS